jgi:RimJ/RimL family protein N-acetyltransferase
MLFAAGAGRWSLVGYGAWAVNSRETGESVGVVSLNYPIGVPERELGWLLWDRYEGQGFALEAATRARDFTFDELGWSTMVSYIARKNDRSIRLATRMGAELDLSTDVLVDDETLTYRHMR